MAIAETARLLASLELQDKFSSTIKTVEGKIDGVGTKIEGLQARAQTGVGGAVSKIGSLKDALKDSNTQIGLVGGALEGLERFVPPDIRPFVQGLEDINRAAPKGLPGIVGTALQGLKTISANSVTVVGKAIGGLPTPAGPVGDVLKTAFPAAGALGGGAIVGGVAAGAVVASGGLLALGKVVEATSTKEQLQAARLAFDEQAILKHTGGTLEQIRAKQSAPPIINLQTIVKTNVFGTQATTTTTYNRFLPGGIKVI